MALNSLVLYFMATLWPPLEGSYLHPEQGEDEDEEEEEEEEREDGGDGIHQGHHQVPQARPVPDTLKIRDSVKTFSKYSRVNWFTIIYY